MKLQIEACRVRRLFLLPKIIRRYIVTKQPKGTDNSYETGIVPDPIIDIAIIISNIPFIEPIPDVIKAFTSRLARTQDLDIANQLVRGIRGLDLRLGLYGGEIWICHGQWSVSFDSILMQLNAFLRMFEKEVIVVVLG